MPNAKQQILFVDDEPNFLDGMRRLLRPYRDDWTAHYVNSVDAAMAALEEFSIDLVVSDVTMPVRTGLDLLTEIKAHARFANLPVVILTGNAETELKRRALDLGAADLLNKPVVLEDLLARIRSALKMKSYQDALAEQNEYLEKRVLERTRELEASRVDIIWRLAKAGEYRDEETGNHIMRVGAYCRVLATKLLADRHFVNLLYLTSPLHDIGKIGIPDNILLKPGRLTFEEFAQMQTHAAIGSEILIQQPRSVANSMARQDTSSFIALQNTNNPITEMAASIALNHHEKWDGTGYPRGLKEEQIPIEARIVAIADVYDALRSERPYKPPFSEEKTVSIITGSTGSHFDPTVYAAFLSLRENFNSIFEEMKG